MKTGIVLIIMFLILIAIDRAIENIKPPSEPNNIIIIQFDSKPDTNSYEATLYAVTPKGDLEKMWSGTIINGEITNSETYWFKPIINAYNAQEGFSWITFNDSYLHNLFLLERKSK